MHVDFDFEKMERLLISFNKISGIRFSLADGCNQLLCSAGALSGFCALMHSTPEGRAKCKQCDAAAIARASQQPDGGCQIYRCHAGLTEAVFPVRQYGKTLAYVFFGQMMGLGDEDEQWKATREKLSWMENPDSMREAFHQLKRVNDDVAEGCASILDACSSYIWMEGMIRSATMSDEQLLNLYISEHYAEMLTLDGVAKALSMSKTKLCNIAAAQKTTVMTMVNTRRMEEAKRLLRHRNGRISEVAVQVGVRDNNYFSKLFKAYTGDTPRDYQKQYRRRGK